MNFRTAVLQVIDDSPKLTGNNRKAAKRAAEEKHPLLWKSLENWTRHRYERQTGQKLPAAFDWKTILDWLMQNLPAILAMILKIFGG